MLARIVAGLGVGLMATALIAPANATTFSYAPFSVNACGTSLHCVGDSSTPGTVLQINPSVASATGAAYSTSAVPLGTGDTFSTTFQFQITQTGGIDPADGFTFVVAASSSGLGGAGQGLGYDGVGNSVAIEFDTYYNNTIDNSSNHVAVDVSGDVANEQAAANPYGNGSCGFAGGAPSQDPTPPLAACPTATSGRRRWVTTAPATC